MKPHPRIRKTIKWGGAAVTVLLVVVWVCSLFFMSWWMSNQLDSITLHRGAIVLMYWDKQHPEFPTALGIARATPDPNLVPGWHVRSWRSRMCWKPETEVEGGLSTFMVPLWPAFAATATCAALAWVRDIQLIRRAKLNLCPKCNYDRTGLASKDAKCPECGLGGAAPASV